MIEREFPFEPDEPGPPEIWVDKNGNEYETIGVPAAWGFTAIMAVQPSTKPIIPERKSEQLKKHIRKDGKKRRLPKKKGAG